MITITSERYSVMQEKLLQSLKDFDYRFKRYQINYSITIGYCLEDVNLSVLSDYIRGDDRFIVLDHHAYAIVFNYSNVESGIQATNNLLNNFHTTFASVPLFGAVVTASNYDSVTQMVPELLNLLQRSIEQDSPLQFIPNEKSHAS